MHWIFTCQWAKVHNVLKSWTLRKMYLKTGCMPQNITISILNGQLNITQRGSVYQLNFYGKSASILISRMILKIFSLVIRVNMEIIHYHLKSPLWKEFAGFMVNILDMHDMCLDVGKPGLGFLRNNNGASAQSDLHLCYSLFGKYHIYTCYERYYNFLASLCSWAGWSVALSKNPEDRFSRITAHKYSIFTLLNWTLT